MWSSGDEGSRKGSIDSRWMMGKSVRLTSINLLFRDTHSPAN